MIKLDAPIVTPQMVLGKRNIHEWAYDVETAIICFRGKQASFNLIRRLKGVAIQDPILYHPYLYRSSKYKVLLFLK